MSIHSSWTSRRLLVGGSLIIGAACAEPPTAASEQIVDPAAFTAIRPSLTDARSRMVAGVASVTQRERIGRSLADLDGALQQGNVTVAERLVAGTRALLAEGSSADDADLAGIELILSDIESQLRAAVRR